MSLARLAASAFLLAAAAAGIASTGACASTPNPNATTQIYTPDDAFELWAGEIDDAGGAGPDAVLGKRCGTLDCHGQPGRPLRIYSQDGLRIDNDAGNYSGGQPETQQEQLANFTAAIGLQPELTSKVFAGELDPHSVLLLLRKPLQLERHEGGQVSKPGDAIDQCLSSWFADKPNVAACASAASVP
jgi:hypothetical protein